MSEEQLSLPDQEIKTDSTVKAVEVIKICDELVSQKQGLQREEKHGQQREEKHGLLSDEKHGLQREPTIPKEDATIFGEKEETSKKGEPRDLVKEAMQGGLVGGGQLDGGGAGQVMIPVVVTGSQPQDHPAPGSYHHEYPDYSGYGQNPPMAVGYDGQVVGSGYGYQQPPQNALPVGWAYSPAQGYYTAGGNHQYMGYQKAAGGSGGLAGGINRATSQGERKSLKMMPSVVTKLNEKRYLILSNPAFIETEL